MTATNPEKTPDIKSTQLHEQPTAVLRETVPMNEPRAFFSRAYQSVMSATEQQHVQLAGPPFALYRGMPTDVVDVEAGFPVAAPFSGGRLAAGWSRGPCLPAKPSKRCMLAPTRRSPKRTGRSWGKCRPKV